MTSTPRRAKGGGWAVLALGLVLIALPVIYVGPGRAPSATARSARTPMLRFTIRELLLLTIIVALATGWILRERRWTTARH
jgi:hypothetical protein